LFSGRPLEVIETLQSLLAEAAARGDESTSAQVGAQVGRGMMMLNRNEEALPIIEQALIHSSNVDDAATTVEALVTKGGILSNIGRWREAVAVLAGAVELSALWGMPQARFRGTYNLHGSLSAEDPKGADQFLRAGYAAAVEFGQRQWIVALGKLVVGDDLAEGRWDDAMELAEELQSSAMSTMDAAIIEGTVASVLAARGDDDGATRKMMDGWRHIEGVTKFDDLGWMHFSQASVHEAAGRYSEATDTIMEAVTAGIFPLVNAAVAACYRLLLRDDRQLDDLAKLLHETPESHERFIQSLITRGDAAIAAMRGDTGRAQILFRRVADEQREMGQLSELAFTDRLIVSTFGAKSAIGKAAEQESRRLLEQVGAHALLARLDDAVRQAPLAAEAGTAPSVVGEVVQPVL